MSAVLTFVAPPPGLAPLTDFILNPIDGAKGLFSLQASSDESKRLFLLDASVYVEDYAPVLSDDDAAALQLQTADDAMVLVVANPGEAGTTLNLMAPIVVNTASGVSAQVILEGQDWPLRFELAASAA